MPHAHQFDLGGREPFYEDERRGVMFVPNPNDGPDGYDVIVGPNHFYMQSRILPDLARPEVSTANVMRCLDAMNPTISTILSQNRMTPEEFHIYLLKVRQRELEGSLDNALERLTAAGVV